MAAVPFTHPAHDRSLDRMISDLEAHGIEDRCVLAAMTVVPRREFAGHGARCFSIAQRVQALQLVGDEHVLQVGVGCGYETAVLSLLSAHVYGIDPDPVVSTGARARLAAIGYDGFTLACHDAAVGWAEHGPYDAILVAEPLAEIPRALVEQLAIGGRIVMVLRDRLVRATKTGETDLVTTDLGPAPSPEGN